MNFNSGYNIFIQDFFSQGITRIAVPIFFCISGYLFFLKLSGTLDEFILKYRNRAKSLFLPYLLWSIGGLVFYFVLQLFPQSKDFFTNELIVNYSIRKIINTIAINPIPYQLWFIRDLIVLVFFSPFIYLTIKHLREIALLCLLVIWFGFIKFNFLFFNNDSILFFCLGAYFSLHNVNLILKILSQKTYWMFTFIWILIISFKTSFSATYSNHVILLLINKGCILIGIIAAWSFYDIVMTNKTNPSKTILNLSSYSFFLYAFHEPVLTIIKKGVFYIAGRAEIISLINYFLAPILTIILGILLGYVIKRNTPKFYGLITGGR
jgi:surface polysaccharide O-acyltransferase-like enzyme